MQYFSGIVVLSTIYPFAKRFTYYPQFVLGATLSVTFLTSVQSLNVNPLAREIIAPSLCFSAANTVWTMIYDAIYAHQDVADDVHAGVKSMAVKFKDSTKLLTSLLACVMSALLAITEVLVKSGPLYYLSAVGGSEPVWLQPLLWSAWQTPVAVGGGSAGAPFSLEGAFWADLQQSLLVDLQHGPLCPPRMAAGLTSIFSGSARRCQLGFFIHARRARPSACGTVGRT